MAAEELKQEKETKLSVCVPRLLEMCPVLTNVGIR